MLFKQVTQSNKIVKRGRGRLKNFFFALAIAAITAAAAAAAAAAILRTFTFEASLFLLNLFIKRLLMLTTVKALNNCTVAFAVANTAFDNFLALNAAFLRSAASSPSDLASRTNCSPMTRSASSILPFPFALALAAFIAFVALAALVAFAVIVASVVLIIVASFALVVALTAFAAALAVAMTLAERRAKVKRLLNALVDLLL
ncbi:hypothetical protein MBM_03607 [Drepanopeziza brunnea f. sp. 'multigermtubi' MB_m1]|uniref:Uncharacterized protein n=1 Tax=Marssonina brunnea f. sp. multigermtubi (strain MB_m1) TaxID=1072389 RepID=K1WJI5_MARBU|nr:uncharacterized protein MBM_03607 [Drepanopeziza brunnea f. sp. 'multigermtubi' MB_m1]EKD17835.1 hypothetical protein MBM_03607 [Drepanopeziza brunnea f. sp. 'multigermtubi' MB_m1]